MDVYGKALTDFGNGDENASLILHNSYGEPEEMPLWYFFREYDEMPELERMALSICEGKVLDIGAGTGSHSLVLQHFGYDVTAIDTSALAATLMRKSNVKQVVEADFFYFSGQFDTLLSLMNGIGIIGTLNRFETFLNQCKKLLKPGGQLIFDSSDVKYLYEEGELPQSTYYGEVRFQYEYKGVKGDWFDWVYIDQDKLSKLADQLGWYVYFLHSDEHDQYLVRMIPK
ncbi:MAG: class I SAM-dependent methyltransferase [Roseivirga sp.]|nr:class I SAM-dependent methyltransferase [Roseivirga sp.]